ncbi:DNA-processing protein DprA [Streptosporangium sp. NBC_01495]|uniref:DNA-processing protein DprA n=1 Tax=Streptosporangium sp. NBC_01495 TaxID=2903899 RepID=UPI002E2EA664|nr:DNA-processing protein DprA [Streptosporangium sp. NBC_01495]
MSDRLARLTLMRLAEPGDAVMGALVALRGPEAAVALVRQGAADAGLTRWFAATQGRLAGNPGSPVGDFGPPAGGPGPGGTGSEPLGEGFGSPGGRLSPRDGVRGPRDGSQEPRDPEPKGQEPRDGASGSSGDRPLPRDGSGAVRHKRSSVLGGRSGSGRSGADDGAGDGAGDGSGAARDGRLGARLDRMVASWAARLKTADPERDLAEGERIGARLVVPGDPEWPTQLDDLGDSRPYALWLHGDADLRFSCLRSIAIVGSRAATPYGAHVAAELGAGLSERGWGVVSGGAYGIDGAAHRGALAGEGPTVAVLACGADVAYPSAHQQLFAAIRARGVLVSECPMGAHPTRPRFLVRNRLIAALSRGTVVVEAAVRSGALNTAGHAIALNRHLAAMPGPVTSEFSAGCHRLIRQGRAICVTGPEEVIELAGSMGTDLAPEPRGPVLPRDRLDPESRKVVEVMPTRIGVGPATIAVAAGVDLETVLACLGGLAAAGYVERVSRGWRLRPDRPPGG